MLKYLQSSRQFKYCSCFILILFIAISSSAQQPKPVYNLLWRISGKGLSKPSYLFGTMHVKDKRVFNFSDSVMLAIQKCNFFALEVHPDTMVQKLFNTLQKQDTTHDLHKMLSEKDYAALSKKFEEKNGYKMRDNINPLLAESLLKKSDNKPGDKESFIDAFLYGIARTMDKTIYGLENTSQQFDKLIGSPDEIKARLLGLLETGAGEEDSEEMIRIYSTGNLENITNYITEDALADSELVARNKVMVNSIINNMNKGSLFSAVGVAHLPGDEGIISQLRKAGYTLTPVTATFTGLANKYHIDYDRMKWVIHTDYEMGYSLEFPSAPIQTNVYANLSTWIYPDIANENFYGVYVLPKGTKTDPANREKVISKLLQNFTNNKTDRILSKKNTMVNGLPCTDVVMKTRNGYQRSALFVNNNILYYIYMGNHLKSIQSAYANRFFNSFKSFKPVEKTEREWITFNNDTAAFSVKLPFKPIFMQKGAPNPIKNGQPFKINMFIAADTTNLLNYIVRYNDYPLGNYIADRNALLNGFGNEISSKAKLVGKPKVIWKDGYEGREIKVIFNGGYHGAIQVYVRGNRSYMLLKQNLHEDKEVDTNDIFFNSFTLTPFLQPSFINFEPEDWHYKTKLVATPKIIKDTTKDYKSYLKNWSYYVSTSPTSGGVYMLEHYTISKYFRVKNVDSLYKDMKGLIAKYTDTIIRADTVIMDGKKAREIIVENRNSKDQKRYRILIDDGELFIFQSYLAKEELFDDQTNVFYTSLERTGASIKADLFSSKADKIIEDLQSADTTTYNEALGALSYYKFTTDELPYIYTGLQKNYTDDTVRYGARYKLIQVLKDVHDEKTIEELLKLYKNLQGKDLLKSLVLSTMPDVEPHKGYDIYFSLLTKDKPLQLKNNNNTFRPLFDSLKYTADHFKQIIPLISNAEYRNDVLSLSERLLEVKDENYSKLIKNNFQLLSTYAYTDLDNFLSSKDSSKTEWGTNIYKYLYLMSKVTNDPLIDKFTNYYIKNNPKGNYISTAVIARINNRLAINPILTSRLMDSIATRYDIMEAYTGQQQLYKIPLKYRSQDEFGRLCLYQYIGTDDYGSPENLKLLGSIQNKGQVFYAYKFTLPEKEENVIYIGITGPCKPRATNLNFDKYNAYTEYEAKRANWIKQAKKMIPELIKAYKPAK